MAKTSPFKRFVYFLVLLLLLVGIGLGGYYGYQLFSGASVDTFEDSSLIEVNQNIQQTTIDRSNQDNVWTFLSIFGVAIMLAAIIVFFIREMFKYLARRRTLSYKNKKECEKRAYEELLRKDFDVGFEEAKWTKRGYGDDKEEYPFWAFIFYQKDALANIPARNTDPFYLISCRVDAKTLEVWDEKEGRSVEDFEKELHDERVGKHSVPSFAGKPDREPGIADIFQENKPTVNLQLNPEEVQQ